MGGGGGARGAAAPLNAGRRGLRPPTNWCQWVSETRCEIKLPAVIHSGMAQKRIESFFTPVPRRTATVVQGKLAQPGSSHMPRMRLQDMFSLPSLENRRLHLKLCHLFKIVHGLCHFPPEVLVANNNITHSPRSLILQQPFSRTNAFYHSFIPDTIRTWNNLPEYVVCAPSLNSFTNFLKPFFN